MGNQREFRQLTPRKGLAVVVPVRPGRAADVERVLGEPSERHRFYISLWPSGQPINFSNLDGPDVSLGPQSFDCVAIQSGGKMWCGYEAFVERVRGLAPFLADALFYVGDEEDYIDEFRLSAAVLEYRRVHSGYYLPVRNFLRSRGVRQTPNQKLHLKPSGGDMDACPSKIYDAPVVTWAAICPDVRPTGKTEHSVNGRVIGPAVGLAICRATDGHGFYLFYCDSAWEEVADTWHETIAGAKAQAEFEYEGVSSHWHNMGEPDAAPDPAT